MIRFALEELQDGVERGWPTERRPSRDQFVQNRSERIHVRRDGDGLLRPCLLWGHVRWRAEDGPRVRQSAIAFHLFRQAKVGDVGRPHTVDQNIRRLQVTV